MSRIIALSCLLLLAPLSAEQKQNSMQHVHGVGHVHMDVQCSPSVTADFDTALALLHNFWYARALEAFNKVIQADPQCAMAYWGAAMTYNHPFWDAPTREDVTAAWALVQKGMQAKRSTPREKMYLDAAAALYKDVGARPKSERDEGYKNAMTAV